MRHGDWETRGRGKIKTKGTNRGRGERFSSSSPRLRVSDSHPITSASLRLCVFALIVLLPLCAVYAQKRNAYGWVWQNPLPQGNPLYSISFAKDRESGFAVGSDSTILRTQDGGFSWEKLDAPQDVTLSGVFVRDDRNAVVVGSRGTILWTNSGGKNWKQIHTDARDHLYSVSFARQQPETGWATGTYGRILKTSDGGASWLTQSSATREHILRVSAFDAELRCGRRDEWHSAHHLKWRQRLEIIESVRRLAGLVCYVHFTEKDRRCRLRRMHLAQ
jgi:Uncharacterized protein related to plant photosystem II stability/assembly factor